jgi:adenosine deaminase
MEFTKMPKIENHLHLEGAIPYETMWQLIKKYGGDAGVNNLDQLKEKFVYRDFNHFIEMWAWKNQFLREYEDFVLISEAVFLELVKQNVKYAEIFISPSLFKNRLSAQRIIEAIAEGISKVAGISINLIVDLVRDYGPENEIRTLLEIHEVKHLSIIGIGIGGSENKYPPAMFIDVYDQARKLGFRTTAHAGEASGPESIWSAIRDLHVDRIGHGTRAVEDLGLLTYLSENKIPIELCLLSNARTKVVDSIEEHPIRTFIENGIPVSINTDDPMMFGNSLAEEYQTLKDIFKYSKEEIHNIILNSINTMWLDENEKRALIGEFRKECKDTATEYRID